MLAKISTISNFGLQPVPVTVEVNVASRGMPAFDIVGLPNKSVDESKHRVRNALINSGFKFPPKKITVNLAPADLPKEGTAFDLPIAVGIVCAEYGYKSFTNSLFYGELSLDGGVRHTRGVFLVAIYAREHNITSVYIPTDNICEASGVSTIQIYAISNVKQLLDLVQSGGKCALPPSRSTINYNSIPIVSGQDVGFSEIIGQEKAKRCLTIAAAGNHNVLIEGPPGVGKTMLGRALVTILPPLTELEAIEVTKIYSAIGSIPPGGSLIYTRPFRAPHHTISYAAMIGGGTSPKPGEISLAHHGVLFMDEFPEYTRNVLEALRQPIENKEVIIARTSGNFTFPAGFMLVACCNPCPCGYYNYEKIRPCTCSSSQIAQYRRKLSGPIIDRIDLIIQTGSVDPTVLMHSKVKEVEENDVGLHTTAYAQDLNSNNARDQQEDSKIRKLVAAARKRQYLRYSACSWKLNADIKGSEILNIAHLTKSAWNIVDLAYAKYALSMRAYTKVLKVALTIADLEASDEISQEHIAEALQYRYSYG